MRPEGVAAAHRELKRANRCFDRFIRAETIEDAEDVWSDFLTHSNRVYLKLRAACHGQGVDWMWWKKKMDQRRDDPLLCYIHHARNSDTHRIEEIARRIDEPSEPNLMPLPVTDAGITYPVPIMHRDYYFPDLDVRIMILLMCAYLQGLVDEAASRLR